MTSGSSTGLVGPSVDLSALDGIALDCFPPLAGSNPEASASIKQETKTGNSKMEACKFNDKGRYYMDEGGMA